MKGVFPIIRLFTLARGLVVWVSQGINSMSLFLSVCICISEVRGSHWMLASIGLHIAYYGSVSC